MNVWLPGLALLFTVSIIGFSSQAAFAGNDDLTITKTANPQTIIQGQNTLVTYTYTTQNDFGQSLIQCSLVDDNGTPGNTGDDITIFSGITLSNGAGRVDMRQVLLSDTTTNTADLTCETDGGTPVPRDDSATVTAISPDVTIDKTVNTDNGNTGVDPLNVVNGTDVFYVYKVTNSGDVSLTSCQVSDDIIGNIGSTFNLPNPNDMNTEKSSAVEITADRMNTGSVICDVAGIMGETVDDDDTANVFSFNPDVTLDKTVNKDGGMTGVDPLDVVNGTDVFYVYKATNTGDIALTNCQISDNLLGNIGGTFGLPNPNDMNTEVSGAVNITADRMNTGDVTCDVDGISGETVDDQDNANVFVVNPMISLDKTVNKDGGMTGVDPLDVVNGTDVFYVYKATNTGDVPLTNCQISDNLLGNIGGTFGLPSMNSMNTEVSGAVEITADRMNIGSVSCDPVAMTTPMDTDPANVFVVDPMIMLNKTASTTQGVEGSDPLTIPPGTSVFYAFKATNTGDVTLNNCQVSDPNLGGNVGATFNLAPGGMNTVFSTTATMPMSNFQNTGTVTCDDVAMTTPTDTDTCDVIVQPDNSCVDLIKMADKTIIEPGETVKYTYDVTNCGDVALKMCNLDDDKLGSIGTADFSLPVSGSETFMNSTVINVDTTNNAKVVCLEDNEAMMMVMDEDSERVIILRVGGEFLPIDTTALFLGGIQSSVVWILPTVAGLAGAGYYLVKFRNKDN